MFRKQSAYFGQNKDPRLVGERQVNQRLQYNTSVGRINGPILQEGKSALFKTLIFQHYTSQSLLAFIYLGKEYWKNRQTLKLATLRA